MDFLSYKAISQNEMQPLANYFIFDGPQLPGSWLPILDQQQKVHLYIPLNNAACSIADQFCRSFARFQDQSPAVQEPPI